MPRPGQGWTKLLGWQLLCHHRFFWRLRRACVLVWTYIYKHYIVVKLVHFTHVSIVALMTAMSVCWSVHHFGTDWNISTTIGWIYIHFVQAFMVSRGWILLTLVSFSSSSSAISRSKFSFIQCNISTSQGWIAMKYRHSWYPKGCIQIIVDESLRFHLVTRGQTMAPPVVHQLHLLSVKLKRFWVNYSL